MEAMMRPARKTLHAASVAWLVALAAASPTTVFAQTARGVGAVPAPVGDAEIARLIRFRAVDQHRATGIVVGVLRPTGPSVVAYGATDLKGSRKVGGDTIFEVAS